MPYYWMQTQHERSGVRASFTAGVCDLGGADSRLPTERAHYLEIAKGERRREEDRWHRVNTVVRKENIPRASTLPNLAGALQGSDY